MHVMSLDYASTNSKQTKLLHDVKVSHKIQAPTCTYTYNQVFTTKQAAGITFHTIVCHYKQIHSTQSTPPPSILFHIYHPSQSLKSCFIQKVVHKGKLVELRRHNRLQHPSGLPTKACSIGVRL